MRTQEEIVARIKQIAPDDFLGFGTSVLLGFLDFEHAKEFLKPEVNPDEWKPTPMADLHKEAIDYQEFAWGKVQDHRGISAERSVAKMGEYLWLSGLPMDAFDAADYAQYGAPKMKVSSELLGYPVPQDEGLQRMMSGEPCRPGCEDGCGY